MMAMTNWTTESNDACPRCGKPLGRPAASRWDNTPVCADCGVAEAVIERKHATYRCRAECVHPVRGEFVWLKPPEASV